MATGRLPDPNTAPVTAKGDLYTYSTVPAKLAVGNNGETLVADSSATTGLRYTAGTVQSNPVINSAMQIWQRGTTFTNPSSGAYTADRWQSGVPTTNSSITRQTTGDTTNLPNIQYCARIQRSSGSTSTADFAYIHNLESVNSYAFAGKTITISFYARRGANYSATSNALNVRAQYSTSTVDGNAYYGPFASAVDIVNTSVTLTTTWQRFTLSGTVGATATQIGFWFTEVPVGTAGAADYYEITGVQIDIGSVALPFRTNGATLAGELAACQRYYYRAGSATLGGAGIPAICATQSTTSAYCFMPLPVAMRVAPTSLEYANVRLVNFGTAAYSISSLSIDAGITNPNVIAFTADGATGMTQNRPVFIYGTTVTPVYIAANAEL